MNLKVIPGGAPSGSHDPHEKKAKARKKKTVVKQTVVVEDDGEGNWLVSYADMMTLLFGFFVILSAFSTPDTQKMEKLKQATSPRASRKSSPT